MSRGLTGSGPVRGMVQHLNSIYFAPGLAADLAIYGIPFVSRLSDRAEGGHSSQGLPS